VRLLLLVMLCAALPLKAEIYRWVDAQGKVHFSDKKPAEQAQDISRELRQQNLDTSSSEVQKVSQILRQETAADRQHAARLAYEEQQRRLPLCNAARTRLSRISGKVIFLDENGKAMRITEAERQQKIAEAQALIDENCPK